MDWLSLAFRVEIPPHVLAQLRARAEVAREAGVAVEWCLPSGVTLGLRPSRKGDWFGFEGADTAGVVDLKASGGWNVAIEISGERCARMNVRAAMAAAARVAQAIGEGVVDGVRLRRVDLAGDFAGWVIAAEDGAGLVTRRRAGVAAFYEEDDTAPATRTYTQTGRATGHTVCAGNPLMARIYDKRAQLRAAGDTEREAQEVSTWVANGTTDSDAVTRVEFQLRSEVLAEFPVENGVLRDRPDLLEKSLDSLWQYCTQRWLRLAIPGTATRRKNWTTDPRWSVAQAVTFTHRSDVAKRERRVGRAAAAQAFGCAVSALADGGRIGRVDPAQANETSAEVFVRGTVDRVMRDAGESFAAQLLEKFKHENDPAAAAARWLAEKLNGAIALRSE